MILVFTDVHFSCIINVSTDNEYHNQLLKSNGNCDTISTQGQSTMILGKAGFKPEAKPNIKLDLVEAILQGLFLRRKPCKHGQNNNKTAILLTLSAEGNSNGDCPNATKAFAPKHYIAKRSLCRKSAEGVLSIATPSFLCYN